MTRHDLFEAKAEIFCFVTLNVQFPVFAGSLANVDDDFGFAGRLITKVEVITHGSAVDTHDAIARRQIKFGADGIRRNFRNRDSAPADLRDGRCNGEFVHSDNTEGNLGFPRSRCNRQV